MTEVSPLFAALSAAGAAVTILGGLFAIFKVLPEIRKLRAEAKKVDVDAALAQDKSEDEHWQAIVKAQAEAIVQPLREEVDRLSREVAVLRMEVETFRTRYWRAITHIRALYAWAGRNPADEGLPPAPPEIAADI